MRKCGRIIFFCCVLLLMLLTVPAQARVTEAQKTLAEKGADGLWELVNSHFSSSMYRQSGYADLAVWSPNGPVLAANTSDEYHPQTTYRVQIQETAGVGFRLEQMISYLSVPWNDFVEMDITAAVLRDGPVHIDPYGTFSFGSGCPSIGNTRYEVIVVAGTDDNGHPLEFYGVIQRLNAMPATAEDSEHDTNNLRSQADYEVEVSENVWWVPANVLGATRYTNKQIASMVKKTPKEKRSAISNLYEALQLFQISNFANGDDNVRIMENKLDWEHHKPGADAVRTNAGCCATDSNWLNYILNKDYKQVGFLAYSQKDGSGHILNYIFHEGFYYFIDLTHYRTDFLESSAPESGNLSDYQQSDFVAGNLHKAKTPEDYVNYCVKSFNDPPARFFLYQAANCLPVTSQLIKNKMTIIYPKGTDIKVINGKDADQVGVKYVDAPKKKYKWSSIPDAKFKVDKQYTKGSASAAPLTNYQAGDVLTLEDYGKRGFAIIDGNEFIACKTISCDFGFEGDLNLHGGNTYSYVDVEMPLSLHKAHIENMDSLVLGDINASILKKFSAAQMVICTEENGKLTVQEVKNNGYYDSRKVSIFKDENGAWQPTPAYWYLLIYQDGKDIHYEFGRFKCSIAQ